MLEWNAVRGTNVLRIREFSSELNAFEVYNFFKKDKNSILLDSSKEDKKLLNNKK